MPAAERVSHFGLRLEIKLNAFPNHQAAADVAQPELRSPPVLRNLLSLRHLARLSRGCPTLTGDTMNPTSASIEIALRIPGTWAHPGELVERMPPGCQLSPEGLILPNGQRVEISPMQPDGQFAKIFSSSCRRPATPDELEMVNRYTVNMGLLGTGGSLDAVRTMLEAAAVLVQAGGAGVFIDNSGLAHGGEQWLDFAEDGSVDAMSFAFVSVVRGQTEVWTMGMHVFGLPELKMRRADIEPTGDLIIDVLRYMCRSDQPVDKGHVLALEDGQILHVTSKAESEFPAGSPMHNPFGCLFLLPAREIAERN